MQSAQAAVEERVGRALEAGDVRAACEAALRGYAPELIAYLRALLRDDDDADEVFARCCEKLWRGLDKFRRESSVRTWMYKLAWHAAKDFRKESARRRTRPLLSEEISKVVAEVRSSTAAHLKSANQDRMAELRARLEPEEQSLLTLRIHAGLSWQEIAEVLATAEQRLDVATIRKRFERLKVKIRRMAEDEGMLDSRG